MILADRAAVLLLEPSGRRRPGARAGQVVLAGALLVEVALAGRLVVDAGSGVLVARSPDGLEPRLAGALAHVARHPHDDARRHVRRLARRRPWEDAVTALAEGGVVRVERWWLLGVLPRTRWPQVDGSVPARVCEEVTSALRAGSRRRTAAAVDVRLASLAVLLDGAGLLPAQVTEPLLRAGLDVEEAVERLGDARRLPEEVLDAVEGVEAAVAAAARQAPGGDGSTLDGTSGDSGDGGGGDSGGGGGGD